MPFTLWIISFTVQRLLAWYNFIFLFLFLLSVLWHCIYEMIVKEIIMKIFSYVLLGGLQFQVLSLSLHSILNWFLCMEKVRTYCYSFVCWYPSFSKPFVEDTIIFPLFVFDKLVKDDFFLGSLFCFIGLWLFFMPGTYCFDCYNFLVFFIGSGTPPALSFLMLLLMVFCSSIVSQAIEAERTKYHRLSSSQKV